MRHALTAAALILALAGGPAAAVGVDEVRAGNAAFGAGRYEAAVEAFTRGIQAGDLDPEALAIAFNNRGVAYGELGDFDNAIEDYAEALRLKPGDGTSIKNLRIAHIRRGGAAATLGEAETALSEYGRAIELDPQHPLAYLRRGQLRLNRGDGQGALDDLGTARRLDPENRDVAALIEQAEQARSPAVPPLPPAAPAEVAPAEAAPAEVDSAVSSPASVVPAAPPPPSASTPAAEPAAPPRANRAPAAGPLPAAGAAGAVGSPLRAVADVNVRSGPGNNFSTSAMLRRGTIVAVLDQRLGWFRVRLPDGQEGYVYRRWLSADSTGAQ